MKEETTNEHAETTETETKIAWREDPENLPKIDQEIDLELQNPTKQQDIMDDVTLSDSKLRSVWNGILVHRRILVKILILLGVVFAIIIAFFILTKVGLVEKFLREVKKLGPLILLIVAIGEVIAGFPIPNLYTLLAIFGGFCFSSNHFWKVFLVAWWCSVVGYTIAFLFCRKFMRERVRKMMKKEFSFFEDVEELIEQQAWKFVFLLRFTPIPFGILNMILSTTKIPAHVFIIAGIIPCCIQMAVYSYLGTTLKNISEAISSSNNNPVQIAIICVQVVATLGTLVIIGIVGKKTYTRLNEKAKKNKETQEEITGEHQITIVIHSDGVIDKESPSETKKVKDIE